VGELAGGGDGFGEDRRDPIVGFVERLVQDVGGPLLGREAFEQDEEGERDLLAPLDDLGRRRFEVGGRHRFRQPRPDVSLARGAGGLQAIEAEAGDDGGQVRLGRGDAAGGRLVDTQIGVLDGVLRLAGTPQEPVGDGEEVGAERLESPRIGADQTGRRGIVGRVALHTTPAARGARPSTRKAYPTRQVVLVRRPSSGPRRGGCPPASHAL
jgi:hypothetical protein